MYLTYYGIVVGVILGWDNLRFRICPISVVFSLYSGSRIEVGV